MRRIFPLSAIRSLLCLFIIVSATACKDDMESGDGAKKENRPPGAANDKSLMKRVNITELVKHPNGFTTHDGELFSGQAVDLAEDGTRIHEHHYHEGLLHGPVRSFYSDGSNYSDVTYDKGIINGVALEWDEDGNMTQIMYRDGVETSRSEPKQKDPSE